MHSTYVKWPNWMTWERGEGRSQQESPSLGQDHTAHWGPSHGQETHMLTYNCHPLAMGRERVRARTWECWAKGSRKAGEGRGGNQPTWQMEGPGGIVFSALMGLGNEIFPLPHTLLQSSKPLYTRVLNFQGTRVRQNISFPPVVSLTNYLRS